MTLSSCCVISFKSFSFLSIFNYKPTFNRIKHSYSVSQCTPDSITHNFNPFQITFKNLGISQLIYAQHKNNILKDVGKQTLSMASMLLFTVLIQQVQFTPSLTITPILKISQELQALEDKSEWKTRILTRSGPSPSPSDKFFRDLWCLDDRIVTIVEDISSPNILNFGIGLTVGSRLPRQLFDGRQSRYGNHFFVSKEGYQAALLNTIDAIKQCIVREDGCNNVPALTDDLYFLTLATSIVGVVCLGLLPRLALRAEWRVHGSGLFFFLLCGYCYLLHLGYFQLYTHLWKITY